MADIENLEQVRALIDVELRKNDGKGLQEIPRNWTSSSKLGSGGGGGGKSVGLRNKKCIRVMQWNMMAQGFSIGSIFRHCTPAMLDFASRRLRILWELVKHSADLVCLQEADLFHDLLTLMRQFQLPYQGHFLEKPNSACLKYPDNHGPDGCAIFYRTDRLLPLPIMSSSAGTGPCSPTLSIDLSGAGTPQNALLARFTVLPESCDEGDDTKAPRQLLVACIHLKSSEEFAEVRARQGELILAALRQQLVLHPTDCLLVCGDFNAEPSEPVYRQFAEFASSPDQPARPLLDSAYRRLNPERPLEEPSFTTWKIRYLAGRGARLLSPQSLDAARVSEVRHTIDYVWYAPACLRAVDLLALPATEVIGDEALPSAAFPSDHLCLAVDLEFI